MGFFLPQKADSCREIPLEHRLKWFENGFEQHFLPQKCLFWGERKTLSPTKTHILCRKMKSVGCYTDFAYKAKVAEVSK